MTEQKQRKFYTMYDRPPRKTNAFSDKYQMKYKIVRDKTTGKRKLVEDEKINMYEKIQEGAEELTIKNLMKKYDINTIEKLKFDADKIVDLTQVPENLIDSMNIISNAKEIFERQSKEIKKEFNNDYRQFIAGSEDGRLRNLIMQKIGTQTVPTQATTSATTQGTQTVPAQATTSATTQGTQTVPVNNYQGVNL